MKLRERQNQSGFTSIEGLLALLLVCAMVAIGYFAYQAGQNKPATSSPKAAVTTPKPVDTTADAQAALAQVKALYSQWLAPQSSKGPSYEQRVEALAASKLITAKEAADLKAATDFDKVTCSQNALTAGEYKYSTPTITAATAAMTVAGTYTGDGTSPRDTVIKVGLVKAASVWSVDAITCPSKT